MPTWRYRVNIKQYLYLAKPLGEIEKEIAEELHKAEPFRTKEGRTLIFWLLAADTVEKFDEELEKIYAFADDHEVWLGP